MRHATRGEFGEIVNPAPATPENQARLGDIRMNEMERALAILGPIIALARVPRLGHGGRPGKRGPRRLLVGGSDEAAGRVARLIRELRPQVLTTHNEAGADGRRAVASQ